MKKKFLAMLLAAVLAVGLLPGTALADGGIYDPVSGSGKCGDNVDWVFDLDTKTLTLTGSGPTYDYGDSAPPWADSRNTALAIEKIVVGDGITALGKYLFFHCIGAVEIQLPASLEHIDRLALLWSPVLKSIHVSGNGGVYRSDNGVLYGPSWSSDSDERIYLLYYPPGRSEDSYSVLPGTAGIDHAAFSSAYNLKTINLNQELRTIGKSAFSDCLSLKDIIIPEGVTTIAESAFCRCQELENIMIPDGVTTIGAAAFEGCIALKSIHLPARLTTLEFTAFWDCPSLSEVMVPESVTVIRGDNSFYSGWMKMDDSLSLNYYFHGDAPEILGIDDLLADRFIPLGLV